MSNVMGRESLRGHKVLRRQMGNPSFTWAGNPYVCVPNEAQSSRSFGLGGFALEADLTLFVEFGLLPATGPVAKQTLAYRGRKYRIDKLGLEPGDTVLKLLCNDPNKAT